MLALIILILTALLSPGNHLRAFFLTLTPVWGLLEHPFGIFRFSIVKKNVNSAGNPVLGTLILCSFHNFRSISGLGHPRSGHQARSSDLDSKDLGLMSYGVFKPSSKSCGKVISHIDDVGRTSGHELFTKNS